MRNADLRRRSLEFLDCVLVLRPILRIFSVLPRRANMVSPRTSEYLVSGHVDIRPNSAFYGFLFAALHVHLRDYHHIVRFVAHFCFAANFPRFDPPRRKLVISQIASVEVRWEVFRAEISIWRELGRKLRLDAFHSWVLVIRKNSFARVLIFGNPSCRRACNAFLRCVDYGFRACQLPIIDMG